MITYLGEVNILWRKRLIFFHFIILHAYMINDSSMIYVCIKSICLYTCMCNCGKLADLLGNNPYLYSTLLMITEFARFAFLCKSHSIYFKLFIIRWMCAFNVPLFENLTHTFVRINGMCVNKIKFNKLKTEWWIKFHFKWRGSENNSHKERHIIRERERETEKQNTAYMLAVVIFCIIVF